MGSPPVVKGFRPFGGLGNTGRIELHLDEYEALKLADYDMHPQASAAREMGVSRPTFTRIYDSALKKIAEAFIENKEIVLEGGRVAFDDEWYRCLECKNTFKITGKADKVEECPVCGSTDIEHVNESIRRHESKQDLCECMECGHRVTHTPGTPCRNMTCPQCGGTMRRPRKKDL